MMSDRLPPQPLPEHLWGEDWQFAALQAGDLTDLYAGRMIRFLQVGGRGPLDLGLASDLLVPGVVINGGRRSLPLAQWLDQVKPVALRAIAAELDGLVLDAGAVERWILATSGTPEVKAAGVTFEERKVAAKGLHWLLVQPDDSGMTFTGFWLMGSGAG